MNYEVIVVGGGHAGCEAALAAARMGHKTLLVTGNLKKVADMPCNPSIGGSAKGIVVREIDALGGQMGKTADQAQIQMKMLNSSKGPAVRSLRAQADKVLYPQKMLETLQNQENLELKESMVGTLLIENKKINGIILEDGTKILSKAVILTTGTYLKSDVLMGNKRTRSGPNGEKPSQFLSDCLKDLGFKLIRLKTGTPQRIDKKTIDFSKTKLEPGDSVHHYFSFDNQKEYDLNEQVPCYLTYTNEKTHQIIRDNLHKSSMYGGIENIESIGARYCPSIEDKVVRFSDKERHQIFLEPESLYYDDIYLQGFSTSMPPEIQEIMVRTLPGLENAKILKYAYAIEYDAIEPDQLQLTLETKLIENLYTAGQINGTSGYEEAACQGLIAGINACLKIQGKDPLILKRNEAYIGVLIDDLITKGVKDPYRLLTSRAEYRLLLRHDNADMRLREHGYRVGLVSEEDYQKFLNKKEQIKELEEKLRSTKITPTKEILEYLEQLNTPLIKDSITLYDLLKRPEITVKSLSKYVDVDYSEDVIEQVEINNKYEGYIKKANRDVEKMLDYENKRIPENINYRNIHNLATEAKEKLDQVRPTSIGQAMRISGVNPADISILMIYLKRNKINV